MVSATAAAMGRRGAPVTSLDDTAAGRGGAPGIDERRDAGGGVVDGEGNEPLPLPTSMSTPTATFRFKGCANRKVCSRKTTLPLVTLILRTENVSKFRINVNFMTYFK